MTGFGITLKINILSFWYAPFHCRDMDHFCVHVNGDVNFDKLVHENMLPGFGFIM